MPSTYIVLFLLDLCSSVNELATLMAQFSMMSVQGNNEYDSGMSHYTTGSGRFPLILDGAMGTELARRGVDTGLPLWSANALLSAADTIRQIHVDYIRAGAQVITTDTFRTNTRTLRRSGLHERMRELTRYAVNLAREAITQVSPPPTLLLPGRVQIAGSIAPVEDCYSPWLVPQDDDILLAEHTELATLLAEAGCDLLLLETMNTAREAAVAAKAAMQTGLPLWVSFVLGSDNRLLSGETVTDAVRGVLGCRPQAVLVNCIPVVQVSSALTELRRAAGSDVTIGAYANAGHVEEQGWTMEHGTAPIDYARAATQWAHEGAGIIGGCCGSTPDHIRAVCNALSVPGE